MPGRRRGSLGGPRGSRADHVHQPRHGPSHLRAVAALTERVRLWTTIVILPAHDAVAVAKQMASIDVLSDGRLTVGVGVGGREHDYRAIGGSFARRWQRMDEQVATHAPHLGRRATVRRRRPGRAAAGAGSGGRRSSPASLGPRRSRAPRAGPTASTARGRSTATSDAMAAAFDADPRRMARTPGAPRRRTSRRASGTRSAMTPRSTPARVRVQLPEDLRRGASADGAAGVVTCFTPDALRTRSTTRARRRRRRVLSRPHDVRPRRARSHRRRAGDSDRDRRRRVARGRRRPDRIRRLRRSHLPRRARAVVGLGHHARPTSARSDCLRSRARSGSISPTASGSSTGTGAIRSSRRRRSRRRSCSSGSPGAVPPR